ncbi:hypothetical protein PQQ51_21905, partial [Paraburkholderia xenovorans]|uniref:hypothetical protein n=1 Tax=Paraburkholderia xenovorans TaxID=36873 RepID=UPI0038B853A9
GASRKRRAVAQSSTNADLVGEYLDRLESLFLEDPVLYRFFSNLMVDLKPIILTKKSVMARLGDDYAVLIELDTMLLAMQEFIIDKQFSIEDYKNFHALLLINEARNGLVRDLQNRYGDKAAPYYKILSRRKGFVLIEKFWAESFIEKYLKVLMKEEGVNHHLMNTRLQVLKDLKMDDSFLIAYRRQTALGFVGERRMIKALIEAVQFRLTFWVSEQRRDSRLGIASLDLTNQIQITNHEDMNNYLLGLAKKIKNKNRYDFSYPVEQADYIEGEFVSDRINEILKYENGTNEDVIISHYYNDTVKIESSSMRAIALGEHKRHPLYTENSTKIKWPATIAKEQQEALPAISNEIELAGIILKSVQDMNEAQSLLAQTGFVTIIEFTENILRNKAKELNITEAIYFNTTVEHEVIAPL